MRSQYRALHYSASRGKKREDLLMCTLKILVIGYLVSIGSGQADKYLVKKYEDMHMLSGSEGFIGERVAILKSIRCLTGSECRLERCM